MADVDHVVGRLLERAQHLERQRLLGRVSLQPVEHPLEPLRRARVVDVDAQAVALGQRGELLHAVAVGRVVDAPQRILAALAEAGGDRLVGRQHELLDHRVGLALARIAARLADVAHQARIVLVELDEGLGQIEVERTALHAQRAQLARQRIHRAQRRQVRLVLLALAARVAGQRRRDTGVVEPRAGMNHRRAEVAPDDLRVLVEVDLRDHRQPILLGHQRAQARRQRLGQHRDRAARQVDAAAAAPRLDVDRRALAHVVRDVGDRDPQARAAVRQPFDRDRVVEVARRLGIDRQEGDLAQVGAIGALGRQHLLRHALGDARDLVGKLVGHVGAGQHLLDLGARVVGIAQHLQHLGLDRAARHLGVAGDLGHHRLADQGHGDVAAQRHRAGDARVVGLQNNLLAGALELAGDLGAAARQHAQNAPLDAAHGGPGLDLDGVAVHGGAAVARRNVHVFRLVVGDDEAVTDGVNLDPARQRAGRADRAAGVGVI